MKTLPKNVRDAKTILFFDTETTGPVQHKKPASDPSQPYLLQLGVLLAQRREDFSYQSLFELGSLVILPNEIEIHPKAQAVHGISKNQASSFGMPGEDAVGVLRRCLKRTELAVAHNVNFDRIVMESTAIRCGLIDPLFQEAPFCTMLSTITLCNLPGCWNKPKWPKLQELHKFLFGCEFEGAHDALTDVRATARCFFELQRRELEGSIFSFAHGCRLREGEE